MTPAIMVQGTGSHVGKSLIVAGLARAFSNRGLGVAPFKPQNMSNNAGVTVEGGEIGRAQVTQAQAARRAPSVHMNPVLLKPESETGAQIIVQGKCFGTMKACEYGQRKHELLPQVLESFSQNCASADIVVVEGAGSPAETNLRDGDIANMGFAEAADVPVILIGDIDRGGVIATLAGTHAVLPEADRARIKGFLINRFRGDVSLFDDGLTEIVSRTGWRSLGVVPHFADAARLPAEDVLGLDGGRSSSGGAVRVIVPQLGRIANFDDLDPLRQEPDIDLQIIPPGEALPGDADLVLLPGSKSTIADLAALRGEGWDIDIKAHWRRGGHVFGICGGYQMLGNIIADPDGVEGPAGTVAGLALLDVDTVLTAGKTTIAVEGADCRTGAAFCGYEIHLGETAGADTVRPFAQTGSKPDGAVSADGRVTGTYIHGVFAGDDFRKGFLERFGVSASNAYGEGIERALDGLADHLEGHLDIDAIMAIARTRGQGQG
jgi:adenosylcobyric acid synthase